MKSAVVLSLALLLPGGAAAADEADALVTALRAAVQQPDAAARAAALAGLTALPFRYEGRLLDRAAFMREAVPALFTPAVRRCLQRAQPQVEGGQRVLWCKPYAFYLGPQAGHWQLIEFGADGEQ
jgi:hypothetical protein